MTQYDNNLRGVLFKNDRKESENHPDYKGQAEIDGVEYWLSSWIKEGKNGKFMSISFTPKEEAKPKPVPPRQRPRDEKYRAGMPDDFDNLPF